MCSTSLFAKQLENDDVFSAAKLADESHEVISSQLHQWIDDVDQFFGEERVMDRRNGSQFLLRFQTTRLQDKTYWEPKVRARLDLPRTKKRLRLMLASDSRTENSEDLDSPIQAIQEGVQDAVDSSSFSAAFLFVVTTSDLFDVNTRAGVAYKDGPDPFVSARGSGQTKFEKWNFRFTQDLYYYTRLQFGEESVLDVERKVLDKFLFRYNNNINWWQDFGSFRALQTLSVIMPITPKFAISMVGITDQRPNEGWRVEGNYLYTVARYRFFKDWAYVQVKPQIQYLRDNDFKLEWSFTTGIEAIFGKSSSSHIKQKMEELDRPRDLKL
jgi:hypothetical protein